MHRIFFLIALYAVVPLFANLSLASEVSIEEEKYTQKTVYKQSGQLRSRLSGYCKKISEDRYLLKEKGQGDYGNFTDILWDFESLMTLKSDVLCPLYTECIIRDRNSSQIFACKKEYDYDKKKIHITHRNKGNKIIKKITYPLKGNTTDFAGVVYFLRPKINAILQGEKIRFYLLSSEPGLYKVKAEFAAEEILIVGSKKIDTIKIKTTPNMGIFSGIARAMTPPTFLWYKKSPPHVWFKYEGLESGKDSPHIVTTVEEITPLF